MGKVVNHALFAKGPMFCSIGHGPTSSSSSSPSSSSIFKRQEEIRSYHAKSVFLEASRKRDQALAEEESSEQLARPDLPLPPWVAVAADVADVAADVADIGGSLAAAFASACAMCTGWALAEAALACSSMITSRRNLRHSFNADFAKPRSPSSSILILSKEHNSQALRASSRVQSSPKAVRLSAGTRSPAGRALRALHERNSSPSHQARIQGLGP
eukprot:CAMPEP_0206598074 /NCGR_PEP_ID=MMETSP0325_2-20121206/44449_1 /ASSEMBLY_ACC=CAM_ASM_000347 /TAXON_ID=2866 /ORGANISM="Crypthecodinium cohnii, Strain Seligo" /LENGTH=214 /DNA_ID=CAMNT_0054109049 /DNA_START=198 /DNA_END=842 /DNA_ORIENTATION=+